MNTHTMFKLSDAQLESIVGGTFYTWKNCPHSYPSGGSGGSSNSPKYIHFGNSSNTGIISLNNIYIGDNATLIINFNQSAF
jgi:hypothetical protein